MFYVFSSQFTRFSVPIFWSKAPQVLYSPFGGTLLSGKYIRLLQLRNTGHTSHFNCAMLDILLHTNKVQHRCHHTSNTTCKHQVMYICHRFIMSAVHNRVGFNTSTNTGTGASPLKRKRAPPSGDWRHSKHRLEVVVQADHLPEVVVHTFVGKE